MTTPDDPFQPPAEGQPPATPPPPYSAPPPAYGTPQSPPYNAPAPQYNAPPPQYGAPQPGYGAPPPGYGSTPGYGAPQGWAPAYQPPAPPGGYAPWGKRVLATLLDGIIFVIPGIILVVIGLAIGHGIGQVIAVLAYIGILAANIWNVVFRQGKTGQTIGKQQLSIKVLRENDGQVIGPGMTFVRQLAHVLDSITCYIGYLWPLWDDKRQTFADKVIGTIVINV